MNTFQLCPTLPSLMAAMCCALMTLDAGAAAVSTPPATAIRLSFCSHCSCQQPAASILVSGLTPLLPIKTSWQQASRPAASLSAPPITSPQDVLPMDCKLCVRLRTKFHPAENHQKFCWNGSPAASTVRKHMAENACTQGSTDTWQLALILSNRRGLHAASGLLHCI